MRVDKEKSKGEKSFMRLKYTGTERREIFDRDQHLFYQSLVTHTHKKRCLRVNEERMLLFYSSAK